ncbi:AI-2E family transporter [Salinibacterium sp. NSLL150]|uniref:AI-2E family transporter n=1 Tax=unclassified Salinibacterium TaxID=2632331 RepID=UPI0018CEC031|nr:MULTISPECIES: AI-2E family transporter [unclassified Salinibacterium]MBH0022784.1 AI-2E family transporter [Salinibacterium sp. SWN248]MBH0097783.1 AI-2E family transporter [Salinibacterium sp. NSLL35]MBH0100538.1 AI-2E family transporter [Salinibacterium sp. NSLL150]MBH0103297.1 AI-2E family transporter [Salinibacterium sp. NSLL16]MBH0106058.1 AI-2E family transporter [Salinibacterium sp. NSLL17]
MVTKKKSSAVAPASDSKRPGIHELWTDRLGAWSIRALQVLLLLTLVSVIVFALTQLKLVVIPVLIALIFAAAASPIVVWMRRRGVGRALSTWIALLGGIAVFGGLVTAVVFAVEDQWSELSDSAVEGFEQLKDFALDGPFAIDQAALDEAWNAGIDFVTSATFGLGAIQGVSAAAQIVTGILLGLVILFFFLKDGDRIWEFFLKPMSGERLARGHRIGHTAVRTLGGYVRGTATVAAVDALGIGIGLTILQVPLALPLSVIVFLGAFIPLVGATVAGILAAVVALVTNGWVVALIVLGIVVLVNQLEGNFLQPVVMAQSLSIHPLVILVALTAGTILGGIVGAVLAVPIAAVGWAILKTWNENGHKPSVASAPEKKK